MRTLGLIGGMSWQASAVYYRLLHELAAPATPPSVMVTVPFDELAAHQHAGNWDAAGAMVVDAARRLERAGAECVVICANTMHVAAPRVTDLPLLHIGDATADAILAAGHRDALLLGTRYTMELPFLRDHLAARGVATAVPDEAGRAELQRIVYDELTRGIVTDASRATVERLADGHDAVILGCTELTLFGLPGFDTTRLHAEAAVSFALQDPLD